MSSKILAALGAAIVGLAVAGSASAQFSPKEAIAARVNGYRETGAAFKTLNEELKSDTPAKVMLRSSVRRIAQTAHDQYTWFPRGSGPESGEKTKAKAVIWSDAAGFKAAQDRLEQQAALMTEAEAAGDLARMRAEVRPLGETCAACHNTYRERE